MVKVILIFVLLIFAAVAYLNFKGIDFFADKDKPVVTAVSENVQAEDPAPTTTPSPKVVVNQPGNFKLLSNTTQAFQTFNNCGPTTLSMMLYYFNIKVSQQELGQKLRPFQVPGGDNDDKSVTVAELSEEAKNYNLLPYYRANGDIEKLKLFLANDLPVLTRTWLKEGEDIGHYRVVKGFDENTKEFIQDDSLQGANLRFGYEAFLRLWQGFNYEYLVLVPPDKKEIVEAILKEETDEKVAWKNALNRAQKESVENPQNPYLTFNQSVAHFQLGQYQDSIEAFEKVENKLPSRMLWYQIDPILAYQKLGNFDKVFAMTDKILRNGNRAFSELYQIRGEIYLSQGNTDAARREFEKAVIYNKSFASKIPNI